jgi:CMP-N,N'-diacetyllegionaminic acid synthase
MNICMVPVRRGSVRLASKNYLKIGELTVLEVTLLKAIQSKVFDRIVVNTDDPLLEEVTSRMGVDFYLRNESLASSHATSDQVVLDFFDNNDGDRVFWLNTVSPLQTIEDIKNFVNIALEVNWKSAVSISPTQVHVLYGNGPLNFEWEAGFARTQDLNPVKCLNYAMMGWHRQMLNKLKKGQLFDEETQLVESSRWSGFLLKNQEDLDIIRALHCIAPDQSAS